MYQIKTHLPEVYEDLHFVYSLLPAGADTAASFLSPYTNIAINHQIASNAHADKDYLYTSTIVIGEHEGGAFVMPDAQLIFSMGGWVVYIMDASQIHFNLPFRGVRISLSVYTEGRLKKVLEELKNNRPEGFHGWGSYVIPRDSSSGDDE